MRQPKPTLPAPHQVAVDLYQTVFLAKPWTQASLIYHGWVTLSSTLLGFAFGTLLGIAIAVAIVHSPTLDRSLMPWIIASQTIPILAIAPMVIVVLASIGLKGLVPKALISTYLAFFPVTVGMVKGLRSPDPILRDLMRTYSASATRSFWKLRIPASGAFLSPQWRWRSPISLVGAIVGELPRARQQGRLAASSALYSNTVQMWSALVAASDHGWRSSCSIVGVINRIVLRHMGART